MEKISIEDITCLLKNPENKLIVRTILKTLRSSEAVKDLVCELTILGKNEKVSHVCKALGDLANCCDQEMKRINRRMAV